MVAPPLDPSGAGHTLCSEPPGSDEYGRAAAGMGDGMRRRRRQHSKEAKAGHEAAGQVAKELEGQGAALAPVLRFVKGRLHSAFACRCAHMADLVTNLGARGEMIDGTIRPVGESDKPGARRRPCAAGQLVHGRSGAEPRRRHARPSHAARDRGTRPHWGVFRSRQRAAAAQAARGRKEPACRLRATPWGSAPHAAHRGDRS